MKYLIISTVGDDSLHPEWIAGDPAFDLCLLYYGNDDRVASEYAAQTPYFYRVRGTKYHLLKSFIEDHSSFIQNYRYIWLPDNDISISTAGINELFRIAEENRLLLCQPAMTGYISHKVTMPDDFFLRFTNFVEVLALLIGLILLKKMGIAGMAAGSVIALLLTNFIYNPAFLISRFNKKLKMPSVIETAEKI